MSQFDFKHNMFYYYNGKIAGLVEPSYLKTKRLIFNSERARDIAGILLRIPKFVARGMTISNSELASIILKLHDNFDSNELSILNEKSTYGGNTNDNQIAAQPTQVPYQMVAQPMQSKQYVPQAQPMMPQMSQMPQRVSSPRKKQSKTGVNLPF